MAQEHEAQGVPPIFRTVAAADSWTAAHNGRLGDRRSTVFRGHGSPVAGRSDQNCVRCPAWGNDAQSRPGARAGVVFVEAGHVGRRDARKGRIGGSDAPCNTACNQARIPKPRFSGLRRSLFAYRRFCRLSIRRRLACEDSEVARGRAGRMKNVRPAGRIIRRP